MSTDWRAAAENITPLPVTRSITPATGDDELMAQAAGGNAAACALLADRHLPRVVALAARLLGNPSDAEDVAQEVFLRTWRKAPEWETGRARLSTWMHRVTVNLCTDRYRRNARHSGPVALDTVDEPADPAPAADSILITRQTALRVEQALQALPERQRTAIVLCHYEGHSNLEAAGLMGIGDEAVESLLARGRRGLRKLLASDSLELLNDA
ncbi:MAG: RNA polymerase sigma factor [Alphaproteobacteria bacterium]